MSLAHFERWLGAGTSFVAGLQQQNIELDLRSRVEAFKGSGVWQEVRLQQNFWSLRQRC